MNRRGWFSSFFHRLFVRNFRDKLLALVLAVSLFLVLEPSGKTVTVSDIPVRLELPEKVVLRDTPPPVTIEVRAPQALHDRLNTRNITCTVTAPEDPPTDAPFEITLSRGNFHLPAGVTIHSIKPEQIKLRLEAMVTRQVPIETQLNPNESPAPGFRVAGVRFTPETAEVGGPASLVAALKAVQTMPIPLDKSISESFQYTVPLREPGSALTLHPATVLAEVGIERVDERQTVRGLPLRLIPGRRMTAELLTPGTMRLEVIAPPSVLEKLSADDLFVYLDLTNLTEPGEFDVAPRAVITAAGSGARIGPIFPSSVRVRLRKLSDKESGSDTTVDNQQHP